VIVIMRLVSLDGLLQIRFALVACLVPWSVIFGDACVMAKGYRPVRRDQPFLLPPDMREWLPGDHPVWLVIRAVEQHLDTSAVHAVRRTGGAGAAGYDPDMLVTLLIWAYANGVTSSRRIEGLCRTDVAFRVICAGQAPDHVTIARFRAAFPDLAGELFTQVLMLCARLGMGAVGTVALDGTKIAASASKAANRTGERLRKLAAEAVAAHAAADEAEDELFGRGRRGDEVPPDAVAPGSRDERIRRALADLEAERQAAEAGREAQARAYLEAAAAGQARPGPPPAAAAVTAARQRLERAGAAQRDLIAAREARDAQARAAGHRGFRGRRPVAAEQAPAVRKARAALERAQARAAEQERRAAAKKGPGPVRNITDPDSRLMPVRGGGFIQGYNAQNVTSADELVIATKLTDDTTDMAWFEPMLAAAVDAAALITAHRPPPPRGLEPEGSNSGIALFLADAGYCSEHNLTIDGPDRLIATGKHRDLEKQARAGASPGASPPSGPVAAMAGRLATEEGITAYRQRGHIAETPHGHIKHNMRFRQLSMRGKTKAAAEWTFACTVHNLFKTITTGHLTRTALDTLAAQPA
jgi:transposase